MPLRRGKVKDCDATNGHVGMIARTLMKDAHGDLIRHSGMQSHAIKPDIPRAGPTRFHITAGSAK
ncbi:hypothetical protein E2553_42035 [Paraburkholderia dipogonis]|uniref:Uncharacterized protein n=1 Tax=Paraburkholderia dipogonis TaxID=1211383 RepID=A0A4Y8MI89_9BURK|nr:hypothetical protein E2553_42035 [Paraburkholderia dipogonis]